MAFRESLTKEVRRRAHFQCCLCKALGIEIHHIIPQAEGGSDTLDNAAPLCPSCHETYGANPTKRKFVREARDCWYELCDQRYAHDSSLLRQVHEAMSRTASKGDISKLRGEISQIVGMLVPSTVIRSVSIPRTESLTGFPKHLDIRDLLVLLYGMPTDRPIGQIEFLCIPEFWPVEDGGRTIYNEFRERFGDRTLRQLAARALDETHVEIGETLAIEEIEEALVLMRIEAVCITSLDKGRAKSALTEQGQIVWTLDQTDET